MGIHIDDNGNSFSREDTDLTGEWTPDLLWLKLPHARWETAVAACNLHNADRDRLRADIDALTAERDELRGKLDDVRMGIGCARGQRTTQYCADLTQRDEVITRLLEMLLPGVAPPHDPCGCVECKRHEINEGRYRRALEIAGRTE